MSNEEIQEYGSMPSLIISDDMESYRSDNSFITPSSPTMSISSSNTNIDNSLLVNTIDNLREENAELNGKVLGLEEEKKILKINEELLNQEIISLKQLNNSLSEYNDYEDKRISLSQVGFYVIVGSSITCITYCFKYLKKC